MTFYIQKVKGQPHCDIIMLQTGAQSQSYHIETVLVVELFCAAMCEAFSVTGRACEADTRSLTLCFSHCSPVSPLPSSVKKM